VQRINATRKGRDSRLIPAYLFAGTSTGANVVAALRSADQPGPGATIVTVMCDTGMKYLSRTTQT
jgi:cysteine synthase